METPTKASKVAPRNSTPKPLFKQRFEKDTTELENEVERLEKECEELEMKWGSRSISDAKELVDKHIENLHEYNEIKDATQLIIGKLAVIEGKTIKQLHEEYGVDEE